MTIFETASRLKLRFDTPMGSLVPEDLWDLPLTSSKRGSLDDIARTLHKQLKSGDDVSFVDEARKSDETIQLRFDIVKHIIDVRLAERKAAHEKAAQAEKKKRLMAIIDQRQDEEFKNMPLDELRKAVEAL